MLYQEYGLVDKGGGEVRSGKEETRIVLIFLRENNRVKSLHPELYVLRDTPTK